MEVFNYRKGKRAFDDVIQLQSKVLDLGGRQEDLYMKSSIKHTATTPSSEDNDDFETDDVMDENDSAMQDESWSGTIWQYTLLSPFSD